MSENPVDPAAPIDKIFILKLRRLANLAGARHAWRVAAPVTLAASAGAILLVCGLSQLSRDQNEVNAAINHTLTVLERAASLEDNLTGAVAESRGFLLDPVPERRSHVEADWAAVHDDVAALAAQTAANPVQQNVIAQLAPLIDVRIAELRDVMQQATSSELPEIARKFRTSAVTPDAPRVHQAVVSIVDEERRILAQRGGVALGASRNVWLALIGCGLLASTCIGAVIFVLLLRRHELACSGREQDRVAQLKREQDRFHAAVKAVHGVLWTNDAQGWMLGEQPGWATLTGQSYAQYQGFGWAAAVHPDDVEPTISAWSAAVAGRRLFVFEHRVRCIDDAYRTFTVRAAPVLDVEGEVREWVGIHTDVTAERTAELTNIRLAAIVTSAQDAIVSFAPDSGRVLSWNAGAERLFGYSETEAIGGPVDILLPQGSHETESPAEVFNAAKSGRNVVVYETVRVAKSGERIPVSIAATRMLAADGRLLGVSSIFHDLRPRRQIETALRDANSVLEQRVGERTAELVASEAKLSDSVARYRLLAEHGSDVVARLGPEGTWQYVSPAAVHMLGCDPAGMLGRNPIEMVHPDHRAEVEAFLLKLQTGAVGAATITIRAQHPLRGEIWIEIAARTLHDKVSNGPAGCVAALRDVTDRKHLELEREAQAKAVQAANDKLEQSNRSLDRLARHLSRARDQADAASRAKSRFLASMSHELRTPLNGILGYAHLIRAEGRLDPIQAGRLETMLNAGQHLLELISGVLSLSEIEQQRVELQPAMVDLNKLTSDSADVVRPTASKKGLNLTVEIAPGAPAKAFVDPTRLRQILLNLLGNAVKFTASGAVTLRLRPTLIRSDQEIPGESGPSQADVLRLEVADTGSGIPQEKRSRLFNDFERLAADSDAVEGAGLGLALSARLVTVMGGSIGYADNDGGGSLFWVELPLRRPASGPEQDDAPSAADMPYRVLIVDDVAMNRDVAAAFLQSTCYDVTCLDNGAAAVAAAGCEKFDVILMDVRMPEMDGLEATRRIRALSAPHGQVPIIALTAQAFAEQVAECRDAGMDAHLTKPFSPESLHAAVAQTIEVSRQRILASLAPAEVELGTDRPIIHHATYDLTTSCLSPEEVGSYLREVAESAVTLQSRLAHFDPIAPERDADLAGLAHTLAGSAGLFGFNRLSTAAQHFEYVFVSGACGLGPPCKALSAALVATAPELSRCIAAPAPAASFSTA